MFLSEITDVGNPPIIGARIIYKEEKEKENNKNNNITDNKLSPFERTGRDVIMKITKFLYLYQLSLLSNTSKYLNFIIKTFPLSLSNTALTIYSLKPCFEFYKPNLVGLNVHFNDATYISLLSRYLAQLEELTIEIPISSLINVDSSILSKCSKLKKISI